MIIGIEGSYRTDFGWVFPDHKDFMLCNFDAAKAIPTNQIDAVIQTNVLGRFKNKYKAQHDFIKSLNRPIMKVYSTMRIVLVIDGKEYKKNKIYKSNLGDKIIIMITNIFYSYYKIQ